MVKKVKGVPKKITGVEATEEELRAMGFDPDKVPADPADWTPAQAEAVTRWRNMKLYGNRRRRLE